MEKYEPFNSEEVWNRVIAQPPELKSGEDIQTLRKFIDRESTAAAAYVRIASTTRGSAGRMTAEIAADKKEHIRHMQTIHFIETGDTYAPGVVKGDHDSTLDALRSRYRGEMELMDMYKKSWNTVENSRLGELFADFASDSMRHARIVEKIISSMMA